MYGLYGLKHHTVEISGDVTDAGQRTREDSATQPLDDGRLSFAILWGVTSLTATKLVAVQGGEVFK